MNGNTDIKLNIKTAISIITIVLGVGIWVGTDIKSTKQEVIELKKEFKVFNEKLSKMAISLAVLANDVKYRSDR